MKATHVVIDNEGMYLKCGEKVWIVYLDGGKSAQVQSVNPSYDDGLWWTAVSNLKKIVTQMENK